MKVFAIIMSLFVPCMVIGMEEEMFQKLQQTTTVQLNKINFKWMLEQEINAIQPYIDDTNGYIALLKIVNQQLAQCGSLIDLSNNEFFQGKWSDEEIQKAFQEAMQDRSKFEIFQHKWSRKVREQLAVETAIQYIRPQSNETSEVVNIKRLEANKNISPFDSENQQKLCKAKQAIYYARQLQADLAEQSR